ncbi:MAG: DUF2391 domain-containing protein [Candidatus Nanosalina sp.]
MLETLVEKASARYPFGIDDFFQQVLGSAILTAPFLFTEEVWRMADNLSPLKSGILVGSALLLGHGVLYIASQKRDWNEERKIFGVTWRYISLMAVSFGTVGALIWLTAPVETFDATMLQTAKVISMISVFAVIGAATADNLV